MTTYQNPLSVWKSLRKTRFKLWLSSVTSDTGVNENLLPSYHRELCLHLFYNETWKLFVVKRIHTSLLFDYPIQKEILCWPIFHLLLLWKILFRCKIKTICLLELLNSSYSELLVRLMLFKIYISKLFINNCGWYKSGYKRPKDKILGSGVKVPHRTYD